MSRYFKTLRDENPEKYPSKLGEKWSDEEESELRQAIKLGIPKNEISKTLGRTIGGINARLGVIVRRCHFDYRMTVAEIEKHSGLFPAVIESIIKKADESFKTKAKEFTTSSTQTEYIPEYIVIRPTGISNWHLIFRVIYSFFDTTNISSYTAIIHST